MCSTLLFISSCDHKRFSKRRKYAIWQKIFLPAAQMLVTLTTRISAARTASLLPFPVTAISTLCNLLAAHTLCTKPKTPGRKTLVTANTSKPISNKSWLQRPHYSILLHGLLVWNARLPQIRNLLPHRICFISFFKPLTFIFNGCILDFLLGIGKYRAEKRSKRKHFAW